MKSTDTETKPHNKKIRMKIGDFFLWTPEFYKASTIRVLSLCDAEVLEDNFKIFG